MKRAHMTFLAVSLVALVAAGQAFAYAVVIAPKKQAAADIAAMTAALRAERAASATIASAPARTMQAVDLTTPQLLSQVQEIALNVDVALDSLAPREAGSEILQVSMRGAYPDLVRFLARFETLPVRIVEFRMGATEGDQARAPAEMDASTLVALAAAGPRTSRRDETARRIAGGGVPLTIAFRHGEMAPVSSYAEAAQLEAALRENPARNPFDTWNGEVAWRPGADSGDLTWIHRLTGVSQIGDLRTATIDNRDYRIGDSLSGLTIRDIADDSVMLAEATADGDRLYTLGFRYAFAGAN